VNKAILLPLLAALVAACATESRITREEPSPLPEFEPQREVSELWSASTGSGVGKHVLRLSPRLEDGALYTVDRKGRVTAWSADDGRELWQNDLDTPVTAAPGVGEGLVLATTGKAEVIALDRENGQQRWSATVSSEVLAPPAVRSGTVVVQTIDGKVIGLSTAEGKKLWSYGRTEPALSLRGTSSPMIVGQYVFAGFASGRIVALRLADGRMVWEHTVADPRGRNEIERLVDVDAPVLIVGDTLYAAAYHGKIVAVDLKSGQIAWSRDVSTHTGLSADERNVYVADESGIVIAFDQRSGASVWKQDALRGRGLNAPAYVDDHVAVADFEGYVHWLAADDGRLVARHRVGSGPIRAESAASRDTLYVIGQNGNLAALRLAPRGS
jgi:outer membrane protein assembly factor BamB